MENKKENELYLYPISANQYMAAVYVNTRNLCNVTATTVILDASGSMKAATSRLVQQILPLAMEKLNYPDDYVLNLITFASKTHYHNLPKKKLRNSPIHSDGNTRFAPAIDMLREVLESHEKNRPDVPMRILTISDGEISDAEEAQTSTKYLLNFLAKSNLMINSQAMRLFTSDNQPDTKALSYLLQINNTTATELCDIQSKSSDQAIANEIVKLLQMDCFSNYQTLQFENAIILKFPWNPQLSMRVILSPGWNIFWLKRLPTGIVKLGNSRVNMHVEKQLTLDMFHELMETKLAYITNHMIILKLVGTSEADDTVDEICEYFKETEVALANKYSTPNNNIISNLLDGIAKNETNFTDSEQMANFLRRSNQQIKIQREKDRIKRQKEAEEIKKQKEAEEIRKQKEAEEIRKQKEAEEIRKQKEAEEIKKQKEAEEIKKQKEAEEIKKQKEAEEIKKQKEAEENRKQKEAEEIEKQKEAEEIKKQKEAEEIKKQKEAEEIKKQKEAEENRKQKEAEEIMKQKEAEENRKQKEAEEIEKQKEAEEIKKQKEAAENRKQKEAEENRKQKEEEAKRKGEALRAAEEAERKAAEEAERKAAEEAERKAAEEAERIATDEAQKKKERKARDAEEAARIKQAEEAEEARAKREEEEDLIKREIEDLINRERERVRQAEEEGLKQELVMTGHKYNPDCKLNLQTVFILDEHLSGDEESRRFKENIIPMTMSKLFYESSELVHLVTFVRHKTTVEQLCQSLSQTLDVRKQIRVVVLTNNVGMEERHDIENFAASLIGFLSSSNYSFEMQVVRLASAKATTRRFSLLDIDVNDSNNCIAKQIAGYYACDKPANGLHSQDYVGKGGVGRYCFVYSIIFALIFIFLILRYIYLIFHYDNCEINPNN